MGVEVRLVMEGDVSSHQDQSHIHRVVIITCAVDCIGEYGMARATRRRTKLHMTAAKHCVKVKHVQWIPKSVFSCFDVFVQITEEPYQKKTSAGRTRALSSWWPNFPMASLVIFWYCNSL